MKRIRWGLALCLAEALSLAGSGASAQQVWKCDAAGKVFYSDKPCPQAGQPVSPRSLQPNVADGIKSEQVRAALAPAAPASAPPPGNACPGDGEIRAMETRASSTSLGDAERQFMQDEVRRAWQCRKGQGRYEEADWAISRQAQAAQSNSSERDRRDARQRAEAMHSAADPAEGDRIAQRRLAEERLQRRAESPWPRGQNPASSPLP